LNQAIVDTGFLYALADEDDAWHQKAVGYLLTFKGKLILPTTVIPEICYLLNRNLGIHAEIKLLEAIINQEFITENIMPDDLRRCVEIIEQYHDLNIGLVDASLIAVAERLKITRILTTDRRHFPNIKPNYNRELEILP